MKKEFLLIIALFTGILSSQAQVTKCPDNHHPHMVDLGIGIPWACCNVTARSPEDYGEFFAWGETREKDDYSNEEYRFYNEGADHSHRYDDIGSSIKGTRYDAATKVFGDNWRMPSLYEMKQLVEKCTKTVIRMNGVPGMKFTGPNGRSIFLPFGGEYIGREHRGEFNYGSYWSADVMEVNDWTAHMLIISENGEATCGYGSFRTYGFMIRPVLKYGAGNPSLAKSATQKSNDTPGNMKSTIPASNKIATPTMVDLGLSVKWATFNLGATKPEEYGYFYAWGETEPKSEYSQQTFSPIGNKTRLDPDEDAAHVLLGGKWRMPTKDEVVELAENCTKKDSVQNGVAGALLTSKKNGNSIFIPYAGYIQDTVVKYRGERLLIWTVDRAIWEGCAVCLEYFIDSTSFAYSGWGNAFFFGQSIRPVCN